MDRIYRIGQGTGGRYAVERGGRMYWMRGEVFGEYDIGDALGPISAGILVARLGYAHMFQVMAAVAVTMVIAFVITTGRHSARACRK